MNAVSIKPVEKAGSPATGGRRALRRASTGHESVSGPGVLTLVLWTGCLAVGWLGLALPYGRPHPPAPAPTPPVEARSLNVDLAEVPQPPPDITPVLPEPDQPPPLPDTAAPAPAPVLLSVAQPNPAIAFALPVEGPVRLVEAKQAAYAVSPVEDRFTTAAPTPVRQLVLGQGEGRQPAPDYPRPALRAGQEGAVRVRLSVNEAGRVLAAEATEPSPWPLLNHAAVRVVRERWQFPAGPLRLYEVTIRFEINK